MNDTERLSSLKPLSADTVRARFDALTPRQRQVCQLMCEGQLSKHIAEKLHTSINTIKKHRMAVLQGMQARSLVDLANMVQKLGLGRTDTTNTPPAVLDTPERPLRLLIVEDDAQLRSAMVKALSDYGYDLTTLANGRDAVSVATSNNVDIVLLDILLGQEQEDGLKVASDLRAALHCGIVMTTALGDRNLRLKSLTEVVDAYLVKPIDFVELHAVIQSVARRLRMPAIA
jgi:DNA-binding NarL/FixJ family response regulator